MIDSFSGKYRFLSTFYPSPLTKGEIVYPTAEHLFQAAKVPDYHHDLLRYRRLIAEAKTPTEAKRLGQTIPLRDDWELVKTLLMYRVLKIKFSNPKLAKRLLATGDEELVEGNNWGDRFWGVVDGQGRNELGKALMRIREELRKNLK